MNLSSYLLRSWRKSMVEEIQKNWKLIGSFFLIFNVFIFGVTLGILGFASFLMWELLLPPPFLLRFCFTIGLLTWVVWLFDKNGYKKVRKV